MKRPVWIVLLLLLGAIIVLSLVRPHEMLSPGKLIPEHTALQDDCFACHVALRGVSAKRCIACHAVDQIGSRTTKGVPIERSSKRPLFHQALSETSCIACHSDHPSPKFTKAATTRFDHALLKASLRDRCQSCHVPPRDTLHRGQDLPCVQCHTSSAWKPASFAHDRYFALDGDHNTDCATCHVGGNFKRYTCYGCHAHQPAQTLAEHREEGISNIDNCVRCHRRPDDEANEGGRGEGGREDGGDD